MYANTSSVAFLFTQSTTYVNTTMGFKLLGFLDKLRNEAKLSKVPHSLYTFLTFSFFGTLLAYFTQTVYLRKSVCLKFEQSQTAKPTYTLGDN